MSARRHLDDLFSTAYENELSPIDEARFHAHMQSCEPCAAAYAEFRATIEALHELPKARMPHVVHLPSTLPVAERAPGHRMGWNRRSLGLVRRFPATAIAGGLAVVLVIFALVHGSGGGTTATPGAAQSDHGAAAAPVTEAGCIQSIVTINGASPPAEFIHEDLAADPAQPAVHLVLATSTLDVRAGKPAVIYAQFSVPVQAIVKPGATAPSPPDRAVLPCLSVKVGSATSYEVVPPSSASLAIPAAAGAPVPASGLQTNKEAGPLFAFQVPAGIAPGTEIRVVATIPANYTSPGSPPLTAELTLTTS